MADESLLALSLDNGFITTNERYEYFPEAEYYDGGQKRHIWGLLDDAVRKLREIAKEAQ